MKIDDLVANLERNAKEQDKIMTEKIQSVTNQHLASYNELLQSNLKATQKILDDQQASIRQSLGRFGLSKAMIGAFWGVMGFLTLVMAMMAYYFTNQTLKAKAELSAIQRQIEQSPMEAKILAQVKMGEQDGKYYIISEHPKAKAYKSNSNSQVLTFPSKK